MYEEIRERCVDLGVDPAVCDALITILQSPTSTFLEFMRLILETPAIPTDFATEMAVVLLTARPGRHRIKGWRPSLIEYMPPPPPPHSTLALREEEEESSPSLPPPVGKSTS
ncbi:hypothetical protein B0H13DRAFT_2317054 [Mycena leptocephala]|nr:hypothetical protein B0H13DRAFT_2317054 [Mycena leptocephala]